MTGKKAVGASKTGFAKDVEKRFNGLDCKRIDGSRRPSSRQQLLSGGGKAKAS